MDVFVRGSLGKLSIKGKEFPENRRHVDVSYFETKIELEVESWCPAFISGGDGGFVVAFGRDYVFTDGYRYHASQIEYYISNAFILEKFYILVSEFFISTYNEIGGCIDRKDFGESIVESALDNNRISLKFFEGGDVIIYTESQGSLRSFAAN
jgi:hypothetical protein